MSALPAYISTSINDGPGCLMLRCPDPSCGAAIGQDMVDMLASDEDKQKYYRYLLRSYIEDNRKVSIDWNHYLLVLQLILSAAFSCVLDLISYNDILLIKTLSYGIHLEDSH